MASKTHSTCDPCSRVDKSNAAIKFCMDCEDNLCEECVVMHKAFKSMLNHHIVKLDDVMQLPLSTASIKTCLKHPDFNMDFFCNIHDALCCQSCIPTEHRTCEKIQPIKEAARDITKSSHYSSISDDLKQMLSTVDAIISNRKTNIKKIKEDSNTICNTISIFKETIIKSLNLMETSALEKLSTLRDSTVSKLQGEAREAETLKTKIEEYYHHLEYLVKNGSNNQIFILLQHIKTDLANQDHSLEEFISKIEEFSLSYKEIKVLVNEAELGLVEVTNEACGVQYKQSKHATAQSSCDVGKIPKAFRLQNNINVGGAVYGIACLNENKIILTIYLHSKLLIYKNDGERVNEIQLAKDAFGIVLNDKIGKIITTLWDGRIQIIENFKVTSTISVPGNKSYGIEWVKDKLFVGGYKEIHVLNTDMQLMKTITIGTSYIYYIHYRNDKVYLSDFYKVYCIKEDGTNVFTFSSPELRGVYGIATDGKGNVYVAGQNSHNIHRLSVDGTHSEVVLNSDDGINSPKAVCFSRDYKKIFVSSVNSVLVFNCEY